MRRYLCGYLRPKYERKGYIVECQDNIRYQMADVTDLMVEISNIGEKWGEKHNIYPRVYAYISREDTKKVELHGEMLVPKKRTKDVEEMIEKVGCKVKETHMHAVTDIDAHIHFDCFGYSIKKLDDLVDTVKRGWE